MKKNVHIILITLALALTGGDRRARALQLEVRQQVSFAGERAGPLYTSSEFVVGASVGGVLSLFSCGGSFHHYPRGNVMKQSGHGWKFHFTLFKVYLRKRLVRWDEALSWCSQ